MRSVSGGGDVGYYLCGELPLGIFCRQQVLREFFILHCILDKHVQRVNALSELKRTYFPVFPERMFSHWFGLFLQIHNLREQVCDLLLLSGSIFSLPSQFFRYGGNLETGQPWKNTAGGSLFHPPPLPRRKQSNRHRSQPSDLLSSFTQSLTSCCSFSSYNSVSDFKWWAWKRTRRTDDRISQNMTCITGGILYVENLRAQRQVLFLQVFQFPLDCFADEASRCGVQAVFMPLSAKKKKERLFYIYVKPVWSLIKKRFRNRGKC